MLLTYWVLRQQRCGGSARLFRTPRTGTQQQQTYSFDDYGNLQSIATQIGTGTPTSRNTSTSTSTNRLTGAVSYDAAGNLTAWNGAAYQYDAFDQMARMTSGAEDWISTSKAVEVFTFI